MVDFLSTASMASLFTPSSLFLFVNLVIATIAITSRFAPKKPTQQPQLGSDNACQLFRSPSLFERVRSFNFGLYRYEPAFAETDYIQPVHDDSPQLVRTPSLLERVKSFSRCLSRDESYEHEPAISETEPECEKPCLDPDNPNQQQVARSPSLLERLRSINLSRLYKSDSIKSEEGSEVDDSDSEHDHYSGHGHSNKITRVKQKNETAWCGEDEAVDAKADDFINRFKQQLRLQRLESFVRYREMIKGN